jgi:hypothetical protein
MAPAPTFHELLQTVRDRSPGATPVDQLAAAAELQGEVATLADLVLGHFVEAARQSGTPWSKIGEALGVSKQGAQQRFVDHRGDPPDDLGAVVSRMTGRARTALATARERAAELGHNYVGTEHLLLGAVADPAGLAALAVVALGTTVEALDAEVRRRTPPGGAGDGVERPYTPRARRVLDLTVGEALSLGHNYVGTEHLVMGLARENSGLAAQVLADLGCTPAGLRAEVITLLTRQRPVP